MKGVLGSILICSSVFLAAFVWYANSNYSSTTREFSSYTLLSSSWEKYKGTFLHKDGRVIDYSQGSNTTSEGQSYAMLRAVWMDDKDTFDLVWKWTRENLKRKNDHLFGWNWGKKEDGTYGFMKGGGENSASDADSDIALALIFASYRWGNSHYLDEARNILADLWKFNTGEAEGRRYLLAGNWAQSETELVINPSYFAPYAWRIFAQVDKEREWESLIESAYQLLLRLGVEPLDKSSGVGLPPDWVIIEKAGGVMKAPRIGMLTTNYSFDAMRVTWRIALDWLWNKERRAYEYLASSFRKLDERYTQEGKLVSSYAHNGEPLSQIENPAMYATALGYFIIFKPHLAKKMYQEKIVQLYSNQQNAFREDLPYYEQNWLWFGAALYHNKLVPYLNGKTNY